MLIPVLYTLFDAHNDTHWRGAMDPVVILVAPPTSARAYADAAEFSGFGCRQQMRMRPSVVRGIHNREKAAGARPFWRMRDGHDLDERLRWLSDLVLHEMIHLHLNQENHPGRHEHQGHGEAFTEVCNRIGGVLGLPPVRSRRRKGEPRNIGISSDWPFCVRPGGEHGGYYGSLWERVEPVVEEEVFSGFAQLCAVWDDERTTGWDQWSFLDRVQSFWSGRLVREPDQPTPPPDQPASSVTVDDDDATASISRVWWYDGTAPVPVLRTTPKFVVIGGDYHGRGLRRGDKASLYLDRDDLREHGRATCHATHERFYLDAERAKEAEEGAARSKAARFACRDKVAADRRRPLVTANSDGHATSGATP